MKKFSLMPVTLQEYIAHVTEKKAQDILAAAQAIAGDKHDRRPFGRGRTMIDLIAECAITNEMSIKLSKERTWGQINYIHSLCENGKPQK